ncbi:MAG: UPF0058 family protein [Candidatus Nanohaloarchaea archaeon]
MKKQGLLHLHGLLHQFKEHYEEAEGEELDLLEYDERGVGPTSIHASKSEHKEAVFDLGSSLQEELNDYSPDVEVEELYENVLEKAAELYRPEHDDEVFLNLEHVGLALRDARVLSSETPAEHRPVFGRSGLVVPAYEVEEWSRETVEQPG